MGINKTSLGLKVDSLEEAMAHINSAKGAEFKDRVTAFTFLGLSALFNKRCLDIITESDVDTVVQIAVIASKAIDRS